MTSRVLQKGTNRITQGYKTAHKAVDLGKNHLTEPVIAHTAGTVTFCQTGQKNNKGSTGNASYGNCVKLDHGDGYETLYAHLASVKVKNGQAVQRGEVLGTMGNTGNSYGTHLHFEVRKNKSRIDPTPYLDADLPVTERVNVTYRVYVGGKWLPWVTNYGSGADGYAGIFGKAITALQIKPARGTVAYRVRQNGKWLDWVTSAKSWAGVRGKAIDAVQLKVTDLPGYGIRYRVTSLATSGWHPWGEGEPGATLDGIQIEMVKGGEGSG